VLYLALVRLRPSSTFVCSRCGSPVASEDEEISIQGRRLRAVYTNPEGIECEIITFRGGRSLVGPKVFTSEHTWFEGWEWSPAACARCGQHLGWLYRALRPDLAPAQFLGLLVGSIRERK